MYSDTLLCIQVAALTWIIGIFVILVNMLYLTSGLYHWIKNAALPKPIVVFLGILGVASLIAYIGFTLYLALRTDRTDSYNLSEIVEIIMNDMNENLVNNIDEEGPLVMLPNDNFVKELPN